MTDVCTSGAALAPAAFEAVLRRAIFECHKWHVASGDTRVLCPFPLVVPAATWRGLARAAEALAAEALAAEAELVRRPELHARLGVPRALRRVLRRLARGPATPGIARVVRFDFHPTPDGFRVSEGNIDAAGGFIEAAGVTARVAEAYPGLRPAGDPALALVLALRARLPAGACVGLLHVTRFAEDRQIMLYLAARLAEHGLASCLLDPAQLRHERGHAHAEVASGRQRLDAIFRFVPADWLPRYPRQTGWRALFVGGHTPVTNPGQALLTQSKRFPALRDRLRTPLPTWRTLVPEAHDPRAFAWQGDEGWVLKPAFAHEGDRVAIAGVTAPARYRELVRLAARDPSSWAVQRRFRATALETPDGPAFPCLGVYVIDGRAAGAYGRLARDPLVDAEAREIVVLVENERERGSQHGA